MKVAVVGSRGLTVENLEAYLPPETTELISGGAKGIDTCVRNYAQAHGIKLTEFLPDYRHYGKAAPIIRNADIVSNADRVVAFWDGKSRGTHDVIQFCHDGNKPLTLYLSLDGTSERLLLVKNHSSL